MIAAAVFVVFAGWGCLAGSYVDAHNRDISGMFAEELQDLDPVHLRRARHSAGAAFLFNSFEHAQKETPVAHNGTRAYRARLQLVGDPLVHGLRFIIGLSRGCLFGRANLPLF